MPAHLERTDVGQAGYGASMQLSGCPPIGEGVMSLWRSLQEEIGSWLLGISRCSTLCEAVLQLKHLRGWCHCRPTRNTTSRMLAMTGLTSSRLQTLSPCPPHPAPLLCCLAGSAALPAGQNLLKTAPLSSCISACRQSRYGMSGDLRAVCTPIDISLQLQMEQLMQVLAPSLQPLSLEGGSGTAPSME